MTQWLMTYSGLHFDILNPQVNQINQLDIAHSLSYNVRFTGHTSSFYSVATHSILVAEQMKKDYMPTIMQLWGLLHDGSEAYLGDIARPLKALLPNYVEMEEKVQNKVFEAFDLPIPNQFNWNVIKHYDNLLLANEIRTLMMNPEEFDFPLDNYEQVKIPQNISPAQSRSRFLEILEYLLNEYRSEVNV